MSGVAKAKSRQKSGSLLDSFELIDLICLYNPVKKGYKRKS